MQLRPDIANAVATVAKYSASPNEAHLTAAKRVLRYLKGTKDHGLCYEQVEDGLVGLVDANWAGDKDMRRLTSGNIFMFANGAISWLSKQQPTVSLSTAEAEYVSLCSATQ